VRTVPAFHAIEVAGVIAVDVTVGKAASVKVTGDADHGAPAPSPGTGAAAQLWSTGAR
jgi:hypothetical protein